MLNIVFKSTNRVVSFRDSVIDLLLLRLFFIYFLIFIRRVLYNAAGVGVEGCRERHCSTRSYIILIFFVTCFDLPIDNTKTL